MGADTNINIIEDETLHARITIPLTSQISGPPEVFSQNTITNILKRTSPKDLHQHMLAQWKESEVPAADTGNENNHYGESKQGEEIDSTSKDKHTEDGKKQFPGRKRKRKGKGTVTMTMTTTA